MLNSYYGGFRTRTFAQIFEDAATFLAEWKDSGLYSSGLVTDANIQVIYYLLYANYGNSSIASSDENRFKYALFGTIFSFAPSWEKRLSIQATLRALSEDDLLKGTKVIYNEANNPATAPGTGTLTELDFIDAQKTTNYKKSKIDAYTQLWQLIDTDVTTSFIDRFKKLFVKVVTPDKPLVYVTDLEEE